MSGKDKIQLTAQELRDYLRDKRIICDCGHKHCQHFLSNTLVITAEGKVLCSECYQ